MRRQDLIRMANQVAQSFESFPVEQGIAEVAGHLRSFWDPRMRRQIVGYAETPGDDFHPLARQAVKHISGPQ